MIPFVGAERWGLVRRLTDAYDDIAENGTRPRLITLEAVSGWGKTRVIQEFYSALAARQESPPYWPRSIDGAEDGSGPIEVQAMRKVIHPTRFAVDDSAVPTYFWWGISATRRQAGATPIRALAEDGSQFEVHQAGLERRYRQIAGMNRRLGRSIRRHGRRVASLGAAEVASGLIGTALGLPFGPGLAVPALVAAVRSLGASAPRATVIDTAADDGAAVELAEAVTSIARAGIPIIIAVEDLHTADEALVTFLQKLLAGPPAPILVVATAWPGMLDDPERPAHRLLGDASASTIARILPEDLPPLSVADRAAIVAVLSPEIRTEDRLLLAQHFRNPLVLQLVLTEPSPLVRAARDGRLMEALEGFPTDVGGAYRVMWAELPLELRRTLSLAVMTSPAGIGGILSSRAWDPGLLASAAAAVPWLKDSAGTLSGRLRDEPVLYGWAQRVDEWLQMCIDPAQHDVAIEARREVVSEAERREVYEALATAIDLSSSVPESRRSSNAQLLLSLALEGFIGWTDLVERAVDLVAEGLLAQPDAQSSRQVLAILERAPGVDDASRIRRLRDSSTAAARLGRAELAVDIARRRLELALKSAGSDSRDALEAELQLAVNRSLTGDSRAAIAALEDLLPTAIDVLGSSDGITLGVHHALRHLFTVQGRFSEAISHASRMIDGLVSRLGRSSPEVLAERLVRAELFSSAGDVAGGLREAQSLVEDLARQLGPDHPSVLRARLVVVGLQADAGMIPAALAAAERLIDDHERVLGHDDLRTSIARSMRGSLLRRSGRDREALLVYRSLIDVSVRNFGFDTPGTIELMRAYIELHADLGHLEAAIEEADRLHEGAMAALGARNPWTLRARAIAIDVLSRAAPGDAAIRAFEVLADDMAETLGPTDPTTLELRERYALLLHQLGRYREALAVVDAVIAAWESEVGAASPQALRARILRLDHLLSTEIGPETEREAAEVLSDIVRQLGPDHPDTLDVRAYQADFAIRAGRRAEGAELLGSLLVDRARLLGEDHTETMFTRNELAHLLEDLGRTEAAMLEFRGVLETKARVFGWRSPSAATSAVHVAQLIARLETERAAEHADGLLEDCVREYGTDSVITQEVHAALMSEGCSHGTWGERRLEHALRSEVDDGS